MDALTKQPPLNCNTSHPRRQSSQRLGEVNIRTDLTIRGSNDIRERIACALCAKPQSVTLDWYGYNSSRLAVCCSGQRNGKRLFAKILLADPYPVPPRFRAPWDPPQRAKLPVRAVTDQIETEWGMTLKMLRLAGGRSVPVPLGRSLAARTIVWEKASGDCLVNTLKWSRWKNSTAKSSAEALFKAGSWLRSVHEASQEGMELIEARDLIHTAIIMSRQNHRNGGHYESMASKILESSLAKLGETGNFEVPVALTHGDFCLSNLLWKTTGKQLYVVDFELSGTRPLYYDLFALVADLKAMLLNPIIPKSVVQLWEESFWRGYGATSPEVKAFVEALALARIFYYHFSRLLTRRERKGLIGGLNAQLYRTFLERRIIAQRLDLPPDFVHSLQS